MSVQPVEKPDDIFAAAVWANPEICSNCFTRCKEVEQLDPPSWGGGNYPTTFQARTEDGELGHDIEDHGDYGELRTYPPRTVCSNCGSVRLLADDDTLSTEAAVGRMHTIADRLEEDGYAVHRDGAVRWVRLLKRTESMTNYDWEIFAGACQHFVGTP